MAEQACSAGRFFATLFRPILPSQNTVDREGKKRNLKVLVRMSSKSGSVRFRAGSLRPHLVHPALERRNIASTGHRCQDDEPAMSIRLQGSFPIGAELSITVPAVRAEASHHAGALHAALLPRATEGPPRPSPGRQRLELLPLLLTQDGPAL